MDKSEINGGKNSGVQVVSSIWSLTARLIPEFTQSTILFMVVFCMTSDNL